VGGRVRAAHLPVAGLGQDGAADVHEHRAEGVVAVVERLTRQLDAARQVRVVIRHAIEYAADETRGASPATTR